MFLLKYSVRENSVERKRIIMRYDKMNDVVLEGKKVAVFAEYDDVYKQKYNPELFFVDSEWAEKPYKMLLKESFSELKEELSSIYCIVFGLFFASFLLPVIIAILVGPVPIDNLIAIGITFALLLVLVSLVFSFEFGWEIVVKALLEHFSKGAIFKLDTNEIVKTAKRSDQVQQLVVSPPTGSVAKSEEAETAKKAKKSIFNSNNWKVIWTTKKSEHDKKRRFSSKGLMLILGGVEKSQSVPQDNRRLLEERNDSYMRFLKSLSADELQLFVDVYFRLKVLRNKINELHQIEKKNVSWKRNVLSKDLADRLTQYKDEQRFCRKVLSDFDERFEKAWHDEKVREVDAETLRALVA